MNKPDIPTPSGPFTLSNEQVRALQLQHLNLTRQLIGLLDGGFRLRIDERSNWPMLGQHMIDLLKTMDSHAYGGVCHGMVMAMLKEIPTASPFVAASMAEAGFTDNEIFEKILKNLIEERYPNGLIFFNAGRIGRGDYFSTLWALRLLILAEVHEQHADVVDAAVTALADAVDQVLSKEDDFIGFYLWVLGQLARPNMTAVLDKCLEYLLRTDSSWRTDTRNLCRGGFVAYDLLSVAEGHPEVVPVVEEWLTEAFDLANPDPTDWPPSFRTAAAKNESDVWLQGWLRSLIAASDYLKMRDPGYSFTPLHLQQAVQDAASLKEHRYRAQVTEPFLPAIRDRICIAPLLKAFNADSKQADSVFVMRWMNESPNVTMETILNVICEEVRLAGLLPRYNGDRAPYHSDVLLNNQVYMRGCKYGIAVLERIQRGGQSTFGANDNVLIELGFMLGQASDVLILYDKPTMTAQPQGGVTPPEGTDIPSLLHGRIWEPFNSEHPGGALRTAVRKWANHIIAQRAEEEVSKPSANTGDQGEQE